MEEVLNALKELTNEIKESQNDSLLTRKDASSKYNLTIKETTRIFQKLKKDRKLVDLGKEQKVSKRVLENLFQQGIKIRD